MAKQNDSAPARRRIVELDMLRGFFIFVIIVDHAQRWPSPLTALTGQGRLWVSAAEGFFIISGLLIGYLRGYKQLQHPFSVIRNVLLKRAAILYVSAVLITFAGSALLYFLPGDPTYVPKLADNNPALLPYLWQVITQQYVFEWVYFLRLYWMMLLAAPLAIWAFRRGKWWLVPITSLGVYALSFLGNPPEGGLQWQLLFFCAATIGFKLEDIIAWSKKHATHKVIIARSVITLTIATMLLSYFWVFGWGYVESDSPSISRDSYVATRDWLDPVFAKSPLMPGRVLVAFVWFAGLLALLHIFRKPIKHFAGWLLIQFGEYSLSVYCLQALVVYIFQILVPLSSNPLYNLATTSLLILAIWALMKLKWVQKFLPR